MFGIKLFKTYNKVKHILVRPKVRFWSGYLAYAPFMMNKRDPEIRLFKSEQWYTNCYEFRPEFKKKLTKLGFGWLKPVYTLPLFLKFGIENNDFAGKWKYESARFEWKGLFGIILFGHAWIWYLEIPESDDGHERHEDFYYEFMMEYLYGEKKNDLISCIKDSGMISSRRNGEDYKYTTLAKSWFHPEWHAAFDIAYERYHTEKERIKNKPEWILCAATKRNEPRKVESNPYYTGTNDILNVELGYRHHDIFRRFNVEDDKEIDTGMYAQGFFTSKGRWVSRSEAADIAYKAGQIDEPVRMLISEDLY